VINVSSISGKRGDAGFGLYSASKFGLAGFAESMNAELRDEGIASATIFPGIVNTDMGGWAHEWMVPERML
jgi:3-oxoacyl-[acyl-carrier protein] reductase